MYPEKFGERGRWGTYISLYKQRFKKIILSKQVEFGLIWKVLLSWSILTKEPYVSE